MVTTILVHSFHTRGSLEILFAICARCIHADAREESQLHPGQLPLSADAIREFDWSFALHFSVLAYILAWALRRILHLSLSSPSGPTVLCSLFLESPFLANRGRSTCSKSPSQATDDLDAHSGWWNAPRRTESFTTKQFPDVQGTASPLELSNAVAAPRADCQPSFYLCSRVGEDVQCTEPAQIELLGNSD